MSKSDVLLGSVGVIFAADCRLFHGWSGEAQRGLWTGGLPWEKDIPGYIKKAEANWPKIKDKAPGDL
jgi:hypothetical protein